MKLKYSLSILLLSVATMAFAQGRKRVNAVKAKPKAKTEQSAMSAQAQALYADMLPNTQKIFIVDSTITATDSLLTAVPLPKAYGQFVKYDAFFNKQTGSDAYVFLNGFGNRCYYTELGTDSVSHLYMRNRLGDGWDDPIRLSEIDSRFSDIKYPYMSSDGQTLYFAGVSAESGLGKHDIYMAKYDADEGKFFEPENIGLPFNSEADELLHVCADAEGMAWFASSRRQPKGKVCVYAYVPSKTRQNYSADDISEARLKSLAAITRIRATWPTPEIRDKALARLNSLKTDAEACNKQAMENIEFIVNDNVTYTSIAQFRSDETRRAYYEVVRLHNTILMQQGKLTTMRQQYHDADDANRNALAEKILEAEQGIESLCQQHKVCLAQLRNAETQLLKR